VRPLGVAGASSITPSAPGPVARTNRRGTWLAAAQNSAHGLLLSASGQVAHWGRPTPPPLRCWLEPTLSRAVQPRVLSAGGPSLARPRCVASAAVALSGPPVLTAGVHVSDHGAQGRQ